MQNNPGPNLTNNIVNHNSIQLDKILESDLEPTNSC